MIKKLVLLSALLLAALPAIAVDVQISQLTDTPDPAIRGGEVTYSVSLLNGNNDTANNVTLTIPLPAATSFVSIDNASCTHDLGVPGTVNCNFDDITGDGLGSPVTTVDLVIAIGAAAGNTIALEATVGTSSADSDPSNDELTQNTTIDDGADLNITQTDSIDPVIAGGSYSYSIDVDNLGPNDADTITVTDTLPTNVSYVSSSGAGWSCSNAGQTVSCSRASITNGASAPTITINVKATGAVTGTITNTVTVSATTRDPALSNNTSTENTLINHGTELTLAKTVATPVVGNTTTTFTLSPRNLGPFSADDLSISDTLPAGFNYISAVGAGWSCSEAAGTVTCTRASYSVGGTDNIVITTDVPASGTNITNSATMTSSTPDANLGNNTGSVTFSIVPDGADLSITKTKTPDPVAQGANMTSRLRVSNNGPNATSGTVRVVDTLSVNETYVSYSGSNWTCAHVAGVVTCDYGLAIANGAASSYLDIITQATNAGDLSNTACVSDVAGEDDAIAANDCATASANSTTTIAELSIAKTVSTTGGVNNVLEVGESTITYVLTVTNTGDDIVDTFDATIDNGVVISDTIPGFVSGDTAVTALITGGSQQNFTCSVTNANVQCILDDGETFEGSNDGGLDDTVEVTITTQRGLFDGAFTNTANVSSAILGENDLTNNASSVAITIDPIADVEMQSLAITPANTQAGTESIYVLTFINNGPSTAADVDVTHIFTPPGGRSYELLSSSSSKGSCLALAGHTLTCNIGSLARNQTETITLRVRPNWDVSNTAWVLANDANITTTTTESNPANNDQSENLNVAKAELDLLVNNTDVSDPVGWTVTPGAFPGSMDNIIIYQIDLTNRGPSLATGVELTDVMTPKSGKQVTLLCDDATNTGCNVGTSLCNNLGASATGPATITTSCSLPDINANSSTSRYLYYRADTAPDSTGDTHNNIATISSNEDDAITSNDSESETTSVRVMVDIAVTKNPSQASVSLNEPFDWDIIVSNNGPGDSANSALSDNFPAGMELTGAPVPSQGSCTGSAGDNSFTCSLGTVNTIDDVTVTVPVRVTVLPGGGTTSNTATVTTFGVDIDGSNDNDTGTVTVTASSIAGTVYNDQNDNGVQEASEHGITTVTMTLSGTDNWGNTINRVVVTDANGDYIFNNLPPSNNYTITETQPANFSDGLENKDGTLVSNSKTTDVITAFTLPVNTDITNYNFAELGLASLQGNVWHDLNNNGNKDAGENTGIANTAITLSGIETVSAKAITFTTSTDSNGNYQFINITAGTYVITEIQPATWGDGNEQLGSGGGVAGNDVFSAIGIAANQAEINYNFGELGSTLSGYVYRDVNDNGFLEGGEEKISNVSITLTGVDGDGFTINKTTTTNSSGFYQFIGLPASNGAGYTLTETQPLLIFDGKDSIGSLGGVIGDDIFSAVPVTANVQGVNYNFGEGGDIVSSISGTVFIDSNDDGVIDTDEVGIADVSLTLTGTNSLGAIISETQITDANGQYSFIHLVASDENGYKVTQTHPSNYEDGLDSKLGNVIVDSRNSDTIDNIILANDESLPNNNFGELYRGTISGYVFIDTNDDGSQQIDELSLSDVQITLTGNTITGQAINLTTTTNNNGFYQFKNLNDSDVIGYTITELQPVDYNDGLDSKLGQLIPDSRTSDQITDLVLIQDISAENNNFAELYQGSLSGTVFIDNDNGLLETGEVGIPEVVVQLTGTDENNNPVTRTSTTNELGQYSFEQLPPSNNEGYLVTETHPSQYIDGLESIADNVLANTNQSDSFDNITIELTTQLSDYNFAELENATLAGTVWVDENDNGIIDDDELLRIANVTITLTGLESKTNDGTQQAITQTVVTDEQGNYIFAGLKAGIYSIAQQQPNAWMDGKDHIGSLSGELSNDLIESIELNVGENGLEYNFGERGSSIQGLVFNDLNDNGFSEANEAGIPNVEIQLTGSDADGNNVNRVTYTLVDGQFVFQHLPLPSAAGYQIIEIQPDTVDDGKDSLGSLGGNLSNDQVKEIIFTEHLTHGIDYNFGELLKAPARISGTVWLDDNHNRLKDDGIGLEGWTVELIDSRNNPKNNSDITVIATVTTDSEGNYLFDGLSPGTYEVRFIHPQGGVIYGFPVSDEPGVDLTAGTIRQLSLAASEHIEHQNLPIDPSGVVYDSKTREPVAGATVTIIGPAGFDADRDLIGGQENISQVTGEDGLYQFLLFNSAPSGVYHLEVVSPIGYLPGVSSQISACTNTPNIASSPNPALVQLLSTPPQLTAPLHDINQCGTSSTDFSQGEQTTQYYLSFNINPQLPAANVVNNHIPIDPIDEGLLNVVKTSTTQNASRGDLVPYTIVVTNNVNIALSDMTIVDQLPPGFKYIQGSAKIDGTAVEPIINGRQLSWFDIDFDAASQHQLTLMTVIGAGVSEGDYINQAWVQEDVLAQIVANIATATIRIVPDPLFDCSDIIGKVFNDKNANGYQDKGELGLPAVRLATVQGLLVTTDKNGRYHIACAEVPNELRGTNFILKVDDRTLPSGFRITSENPRVVRLTRGKLVKADFGATIHRVVRIQLNALAFDGATLQRDHLNALNQAIKALQFKPSVLRLAYQQENESEQIIDDRLNLLIEKIEQQWQDCDCQYELMIEQEVTLKGDDLQQLGQKKRVNHE